MEFFLTPNCPKFKRNRTTQNPLGHFKMVMSNRLMSILIYFPL